MSNDKSDKFRALHVSGTPLCLYNIWDAGTAAAIVEAGAPAVATSSASVAIAHGANDGEDLSLDLVLANAARICAKVPDTPVSIDFEGGYADVPDEVAANVVRLIETGAVGMNFEDGKPGASGIFEIDEQVVRIEAARDIAAALFINARTDLFLQAKPEKHEGLMTEAVERGISYAKAGADGFFVPGLINEALIARMCEAVSLPVNVMMMPGAPSVARLSALGVARVSFGPFPYLNAMERLVADYREQTA
ncbi:MAG: isocitrate lyase/phosphoenolpyruvate mutase family protein [Pacificimonas sp.]